MKKYDELKLAVLVFAREDVIRTSEPLVAPDEWKEDPFVTE